jgi:hypothetical protein
MERATASHYRRTTYFMGASFGELFTPIEMTDKEARSVCWSWENNSAVQHDFTKMDHSENRLLVGPHIYVSGELNGSKRRRVLNYKPSDMLLKWLSENMLSVEYDRITFRATLRKGDVTLITAQSGLILASRWLSLIETKELPL